MSTTYDFSNLDFEVLKTNILNYIKESSIFIDYQFDGSALNSIASLLTYITLQQNFYLSMVSQELYLDTAKLYRNAVAIAKSLNYTPKRKISSSAVVDFTIPNLILDDSEPVLIPKHCQFLIDDVPFVTEEEHYITQPTAIRIKLFQREPKEEIFQYDGNPKELDYGYDIDDQFFATNIIVTIYSTEDLLGGEIWTKYNNTLDADKDSKIYYLETNLNDKLVLSFGDGTIGKSVPNNYWIKIEYALTTGEKGNSLSEIELNQTINSGNIEYTDSNAVIEFAENNVSIGGIDEESLESIKYRAPKYYEAQNRAVTGQDYQVIMEKVKEEDDDVDFNIGAVWDGSEQEPPVYGTVFAVFKPTDYNEETGENDMLSELQKDKISSAMKKYMPLALRFIIKDPTYIYIRFDSKIYYNSAFPIETSLIKTNLVNWFDEVSTTYESKLKYSNALTVIDETPGVINNLTEITFFIRFAQAASASNIYEFNIFNELKSGSIKIKSNDVLILEDDKETGKIYELISGDKNEVGYADYEKGFIYFKTELINVDNNILIFDTAEDDITFLHNNLPILSSQDINLIMVGK